MIASINITPHSRRSLFISRQITEYALFEDRHQLPRNVGPLFVGYDWKTHKGIRNKVIYERAVNELRNGQDIVVYITGLTPALTEFLAEAIQLKLDWLKLGIVTGGVRVRHYDRGLGGYFEQLLFSPQCQREPF